MRKLILTGLCLGLVGCNIYSLPSQIAHIETTNAASIRAFIRDCLDEPETSVVIRQYISNNTRKPYEWEGYCYQSRYPENFEHE